MNEKQIAIGRRAVACKDWRWMSGMATAEGHRVVLVDDDVLWMVYNEEGKCKPGCVEDFVPDLSDPATMGGLLALVREAWGDDEAYANPWHDEDGGWTVCVGEEDRSVNVSEGDTEAEALVFALEDAP
jgi:hypothetical protein